VAEVSRWQGDEAIKKAKSGAGRGLEKAAEHVLSESQKIVPFTKGRLHDSGASGLLHDGRAGVTYTYRGAVDAHERMEITPANGRQRKYLERAANDSKSAVAKLIAAEIERTLK
jgi:hypothetical protein